MKRPSPPIPKIGRPFKGDELRPRRCPQCLEDFQPSRSMQRLCSMRCYGESQRRRVTLRCEGCGATFDKPRSQQATKYCSRECMMASTTRRRVTRCARCGEEYERASQLVGRSDAGKYCTRACYFAAVNEAKQKPVTRTCPACGEAFTVPARFGRRVYCSRPCQARGRVRVESERSRGPGWRARAEEVRVRDGRRCVRCGVAELPRRRHAVDHIVPWIIAKVDPVAANDHANLATLCHPCHGIKTAAIEPRVMRGDWLALSEFYGAERAKDAMSIAIPDTKARTTMSSTGVCRGCGATMRWAVTDKGKGIPLDPDPVDDGNLVLDGEEGDGRPRVRYVRKGEDTGILPRYKAHFATCPNAADFKKR